MINTGFIILDNENYLVMELLIFLNPTGINAQLYCTLCSSRIKKIYRDELL